MSYSEQGSVSVGNPHTAARENQTNANVIALKAAVDKIVYYAAEPSELHVHTSTAETDVINFTLPGNTLGASGAIRVIAMLELFNNSGGAVDFDFFGKYGSSLVCNTQIASFSNGTQNYLCKLEFILQGAGTTSTQNGVLSHRNQKSGADAVDSRITLDTGTEDSTGALALLLSVQMNTSHVDTWWKRRYALVEQIQAVTV